MKLLKIDLDYKPPKKWLEMWIATRGEMLNRLGHTVERIDMFTTKRGMHIYIKLGEDVSADVANLLQFLSGDDHTRVKINAWRIERGIKRWNKLFHKVLHRKKAKALTCYYCGNRIPIPDKWIKNEVQT